MCVKHASVRGSPQVGFGFGFQVKTGAAWSRKPSGIEKLEAVVAVGYPTMIGIVLRDRKRH